MKVLLKKEEPVDYIHLDDVTTNHLVVAVLNNRPCILSKGYDEEFDHLSFMFLQANDNHDAITIGNGYSLGRKNTIEKMIIEAYEVFDDAKLEVFEQKNWKEALQWLIKNVE